MTIITGTERRLASAVQLGIIMLNVEANDHRDNGFPRKADAVEGAIKKMQEALDEYMTRMNT